MPPSRSDYDVCVVGHARLGEVGGVTSWARGLVAALPEMRIVVTTVGGRPNELPAARVYHALTPAVAEAIAPLARRAGRPVVLTCHAMNESWLPEGWHGEAPLDASGPGGNPGHPGHPGRPGRDRSHWVPRPPTGADAAPGILAEGPTAHRRGSESAYLASDVIVAVSRAVAESHIAAGARAERTVVIPNGVAPRSGARAVEDPLVGYVGRLAPIKGIERLMRAVQAVRREIPEARLVLVGPDDGPAGYADSLRRMAARPSLRRAVTFAGACPPALWYPRMACLALASESEGMPLAVLEAMASGVPCVVPDVGGCAEAVGDAGLVVPPRDVDALAGALVGLLGDAAEAARLGALARERASAWTARDVAAAYSDLYLAIA